MLAVLIWWLVIQVVGLIALPIALKLLRFLPDRGFGFARQVGLLLVGYVFWLLVSLGLLQNTTASIVFVLAAVGGVSLWIWQREGRAMRAALRAQLKLVIATEALFLAALAAFALFRAYNPEIAGTEKPMEFAFINGILRSRTFPPRDPWLSGYAISYYYFGYVIVAMLTRLSGLASDVTFNLTVAMLFALTVSGAFSLVYNLAQGYLNRRAEINGAIQGAVSRASILAGLVGSVFIALMGNLEGVFELIRARGLGSAAFWRWLDIKNMPAPTPGSPSWIPRDNWWWWRASRVVHDRDALGHSMEVIDEFPFFSFLLGDNHPHVLALPFMLLALALALNLLMSGRMSRAAADEPEKKGLLASAGRLLRELWAGGPFDFILWVILLGSFGFLNTWDILSAFGVFVLAYAIRRQLDEDRPGWGWVADVLTFGVGLGVAAFVFYLPFYLGFRSQAGGIGLVGAIKTRPHQYLLMFGTFIYLLVGLLAALFIRRWRGSAAERRLPPLAQGIGGAFALLCALALTLNWWTAALGLAIVAVAATVLVWGSQRAGEGEAVAPRLEPSSLFALLIAIVGVLLTVSVEVVFLRDTFGTRMNTVFKFYYQAWVLMGIAAAYGAFYVAHALGTAGGRARWGIIPWALVGIVLVGAGLSYTIAASISKANYFQGTPTLDGTRHIAQYRPDDYAAIQWLRANAPLDAVMLEATGNQYSDYNWVSAHTGIPTVLGWGGHELQWRGNYDEPGKREQDILAIYQSVDAGKTLTLLDKYGIDYVYIGRLEREKYRLSQPMIRKFDRIMVRAFENGGVIIYARSR